MASSHKPLAETVMYRVFSPLFDSLAPAQGSSKFILDFLKVIINSIVCLAPVNDFYTSPKSGIRRNADGALGRGLSNRKKTPCTMRLGSGGEWPAIGTT